MIGKQLIDGIRRYHLEKSKITILDLYHIDFDISLDKKANGIYDLLNYSFDLNRTSNTTLVNGVEAFYDYDSFRETNDSCYLESDFISLDEANKFLKYNNSSFNDGEKIIQYIERNNLQDYIILIDKNYKFKFVKRLIIEDSYTIDNNLDSNTERNISLKIDDVIKSINDTDLVSDIIKDALS